MGARGGDELVEPPLRELGREGAPERLAGRLALLEPQAAALERLEKLEEAILLQAELLELKANPNRSAEGIVIEAKLERGRGAVATILVQRGTLKIGDIFVTGSESGRVRALINERGEKVEEAGPSEPVEVLGLNGTPFAGDDFIVVESDTRAREVADFRAHSRREADIAASSRGTLEQMLSKIKEGEIKELCLIIKADVAGSIEALKKVFDEIEVRDTRVKILHTGVGGIT